METLDIRPKKTKEQFLKNYDLHDKAIEIAKPMILGAGFTLKSFGDDRRYESVWEKGGDKPDCFLVHKSKEVGLLDWKGKNQKKYYINKRAYDSYISWGKRYHLPVFVVMVIIPTKEIKIVEVPSTEIKIEKAWDMNLLVKFKEDSAISIEELKKRLKV